MKENYGNISDKELVRHLIDGEESAFCKLYTAYKKRLMLFALKFVKSEEIAEDLVQDTFTVVWQSRSFLNIEVPIASYLFMVIRNRVYNYLRDDNCHSKIREELLLHAIDYTENTKDEIFSSDLSHHIHLAMQRLSPRQRQVFIMSRQKLMSHKEISNQLQISVSTVQEHISSSLKIIRLYFKNEKILYILLCFIFLLII